MATLSVEYVDWRDVTFKVEELPYYTDQYDKFIFRIEQNGVQIVEYSYPVEGQYSWFTWEWCNPDYLGYNPLSPDCDYVVYVDCYYNKVPYTLGPVEFSTDSISPPPGEDIAPGDLFAYVPIRDQGDYGSCVAEALACSMDIFREVYVGDGYENFSSAYIYGSDKKENDEWMFVEDALDNCLEYGSPRWEISSGFFPDSMSKSEAVDFFKSITDPMILYHAKNQCFDNYMNIDFYETDAVSVMLRSGWLFIFTFRVPKNFSEIKSSGIVPQPKEYSGVNHSLVIIGLTTINGKKHWIAQNSWGEDWGDGGRCYIPYDWGCGVQSPCDGEFDELTSWTLDCYVVDGSNYTGNNPTAVYDVDVYLSEEVEKEINLSWGSDEEECEYVVLARQKGAERWYRKASTGNTNVTCTVDNFGTYEFMIITINKDYYCSPQSEIVEIDVIDPFAIPKWQWTSPMDGDLEVMMSDTLGCRVVRPITACEWDEFRGRINEAREYNNIDPYPFQYDVVGVSNGFDADSTIFTPEIYNEAAEAIREMVEYFISEGYGGYLTDDDLNAVSDIDENTILSASLFTGLRDVLNKFI